MHRLVRASLAAIAVPPLLVAWLVAARSVDAPIGDQWALSLMFAGTGVPSVSELLRQGNDSLLVFPKLLWVGMGRLSHWNTTREMWVTLALMLAVGWLLLFNWWKTIAKSPGPAALPLIPASVVFFSYAQHENFLWGIQLVAYVALAALLATLTLARARMSFRLTLAWSAVIGVVAMFSFSNGLLVMPLTVPALLWFGRGRHRGAWLAWAGWLAVLGGSAWFYMQHLHPEVVELTGQVHGVLPAVSLRHAPGQTVSAYLGFIGSSLSWGGPALAPGGKFERAVVGGLLVLVALVGAVAWLLVRRRSAGTGDALAVWGTLAAYGIASGVLIVLGRLNNGPEYMLSSRYVAFSAPVIIAMLALSTLAVQDAWQACRPPGRPVLATAASLGLSAVTLLAVLGSVDAIDRIRDEYRARLGGKAALQFLELARDADLGLLNWSGGALVRERAPMLFQVGALVEQRHHTAYRQEDPQFAIGCIDPVTPLGESRVQLSGWGYLPARGRPVDAVIVTRRLRAAGVAVAIAVPHRSRRDAQAAVPDDATDIAWETDAPLTPDGTRVWALDVERNEAFELTRACRP